MLNKIEPKLKLKIMIILASTLILLFSMSNFSFARPNELISSHDSICDNIGVKYNIDQYNNRGLYFEDLANKKELFCVEHGVALPSRLSASSPSKDATVEAPGIKVEVPELTANNKKLRGPFDFTNSPNARNPYGQNGYIVTTSRTQPKYNTQGGKDLSLKDSYVLAHEKRLGYYPDKVQQGLWGVLGQFDLSINTEEGTDGATREQGKSLSLEAKAFEEAVNNVENFKKNNGNNLLVDKTDYNKLVPAYNEKTNKILVGPFKIDYIRECFVPAQSAQSEMVNSDGVVSFAEIESVKLYADDAKTQEINDWQFIYPDVDASKRRVALKQGDEKYKYPYPGEEFYVELKKGANIDVKTLSRLTFKTAVKGAEGKSYELSGDFNNLDWIAKDRPIPCKNAMRVCRHGLVYHKRCPSIYCSIHKGEIVGNGHLKGHDFYIEGEYASRNVHSQNIIALSNAKINTDKTMIETELGNMNGFFLPIIPIPIGFPRGDECEYIPWLPVEPIDPNIPPVEPPIEPKPDPDPVIPLTFEIAGNVWLDNPTGKETLTNGTKDSSEKGLANIEVYLYERNNDNNPVAKTVTDSNGHYSFGYIEIGKKYYIDFIYDGMTYKTTKYLGTPITESIDTDLSSINEAYKNNPEKYLNSSHAIENIGERDMFNSKFFTISNNMATGITGQLTPLKYKTWTSTQGTMSSLITTDSEYMTLPEFKMHARSSTTGLYFPLNEKYHVDDEDLDLSKLGPEYYYTKTYPTLKNVNLGLVKREQGDFAVKNDVYQTIVTTKKDLQTYKHNDKTTNSLTYDANTRTEKYYVDKIYTQEINPDDYTWRFDSSYGENANISSTIFNQTDELNVYIEYKFLIRNQSSSQFGSVKNLVNYFDKDLVYDTKYDLTNMTSWIEINMTDDKESSKKEVKWDYIPGENGYDAIATDDLSNEILGTGETLEVHLILKVKKDASRAVILNSDNNEYYNNILEISQYSFNEGLIDKDSNPGSSNIGNETTYEDDTDTSPQVEIILDRDYLFGNIITGYTWEDLKQENLMLENNHFTGDGLKGNDEKKINNIKVELLEVLTDKVTGNEIEILVRSAVRTGEAITISNGTKVELEEGKYMFANLPTGTYKVKFTYGDEYQLKKDVTYNAQDYKSLATDILKQQYNNAEMDVMLLVDTSEGMNYNNRTNIVKNASKELINTLYEKVQKVKVGVTLFSEPKTGNIATSGLVTKPSKNELLQIFNNNYQNLGANLENTVKNAISTLGNSNKPKVMIIVTDGYMENSDNDRKALEEAARAGIKVISVVCSMDEWPINTFGTESTPTAGNLYYISDINLTEYITEVALEDALLEIEKTLPNLTDAKDVQNTYNVAEISKVGDIHSRQSNMDYTSVMVNENATIVDGQDSKDIAKFAEKTQVTAITPKRTIMLSHDNNRTAEINLGLIERPKVEMQIKEEVSRIQVKLSNGEIIIDTAKDLTQNVLLVPNDKYAIYMDDEIMQGSTLIIDYKVTVINNGQVDILGEYFDYDMYNPTEVAKFTATVPTRIGTIYNYFDNLTFRAEENNKIEIEENAVKLDNLRFSKGIITNAKDLLEKGREFTAQIAKIETKYNDGKTVVLPITTMWERKSNIPVADDVADKIKKGAIQIAQTNSLRDLELYPVISKEVQVGNMLASVSTYIHFSKVLSPNDNFDTLSYKNAVEIVERLNTVGRRDYVGVPGNYAPYTVITEYDSAKPEGIMVLNPLGDQKIYYALIAGCAVIFIAGVVFIKKRVL